MHILHTLSNVTPSPMSYPESNILQIETQNSIISSTLCGDYNIKYLAEFHFILILYIKMVKTPNLIIDKRVK